MADILSTDLLHSFTTERSLHSDSPAAGPSPRQPSTTTTRIRKRRARTHFSPVALAELETAFRRSAYPDVEERERLAVLIQQPEARVHTWFQNKRSRTRRNGRHHQAAHSATSGQDENTRSHISEEDIDEMRVIDMTLTSDDEGHDSRRPNMAPTIPMSSSPLVSTSSAPSSWLSPGTFSSPFHTPYSTLSYMTSLAARQLTFPGSPLMLQMPSLLSPHFLSAPYVTMATSPERPLQPVTPNRRPGDLFRPVDFSTLDHNGSLGQDTVLDLSVSPTSVVTGSSSHTSGYYSDRDATSPAIDICN